MNSPNFPGDWYIAPAKITDYLLNSDHPDGGSKAVYFRRHGFGAARGDELAFALFAHAQPDNFVRETISPRGDVKFIFEGDIATPTGLNIRIRSVWLIDGPLAGHLVTAYPI